MTQKEVVQNERLTVAVRVRPPSVSVEAGNVVHTGQRAVAVLNSQVLLLTEPPPSPGDLEHHFRTGTIFNNTRYNQRLNNNISPAKQQQYEFDTVFDESVTQEEVYKITAAPLIRSVLDGFYATIFAYGATSSGKTYTMIGTQSNPGIMARAVDDIFHLAANKQSIVKTEVYLSYLEVYNEQIRDLLRPVAGLHLELREDKDQVHVAGLTEIRTTSTIEVLNLLQKGNKARTMEATAANMTSSRSHAVLLVTVRQKEIKTGDKIEGKLYLIDLAGSERASNTKNSGVRLREGGHINRSLLALGNCITALASGDDKYINYRDSKLTRLLKAALGGPSKTAMIAHISPGSRMYEETRNTLLYAQRARAISNRVKKFINLPPNIDGSSLNVIQELRNEVKRLQMKLEEKENSDINSPIESPRIQAIVHSPVKTPIPHHSTPLPNNDRDRPELNTIKQEIHSLFDEEFKLRNDLLKLDGAMLQSALDCEILRLMVLDWENLRVGKEVDIQSSSEESDPGKTEINSVMIELKEVRAEQDKLLTLKTEVEEELKRIRGRIVEVEEEATQYLPDVQRIILTLLCKLQQEQVSKMSIEIEAELKRRGALLLRCLRQKALGEAIIHRQRHFLNAAISGGYGSNVRESLNSRGAEVVSPFFPSLTKPSRPITQERLFHTPPNRNSSRMNQRLPPISGSSSVVPRTTKYTDYKQSRQHYNRKKHDRSSSEEELRTDHNEPEIQTINVQPQSLQRNIKQRSSSQDRYILTYT